jgi:hypothetical protein
MKTFTALNPSSMTSLNHRKRKTTLKMITSHRSPPTMNLTTTPSLPVTTHKIKTKTRGAMTPHLLEMTPPPTSQVKNTTQKTTTGTGTPTIWITTTGLIGDH